MSTAYTVGFLALSVLMILSTIAIGKLFDYIRRLVDMLDYHQQRLDLYNVRIKNLQLDIKYLIEIIGEKNK